MRSRIPKAMHELGGRTLLAHVLTAAERAGTRDLAIVVGPDHDTVREEADRVAPTAQVFVQRERRGTAHAVLTARKAIERGADDLLVVFSDTPLVRPQTLEKLRAALAEGVAVAVLGFRPENPKGYGRLLLQGEELTAIREDRDATPDERRIDFCNGGLMALAGKDALPILRRIDNKNAKGEYYLTDAVAVARSMGLRAKAIETSEDDVRGINTKMQLAEAEAVLQRRLRAAAMEAGVTLVAPETIFLSADTKFGKDVTVEPNVVFGSGVVIDRLGTRAGFLIFIVVWSVSAMAHALAQGVWSLGLLRLILGAGEAGNWPAGGKAIAEWLPKSRRAFGMAVFDGGSAVRGISA